MKKIFISHGDIILDKIYDSNLNLIKQDGGGSNWNSLYNLSYMGETCYAIGSCGNDEEGIIALDSLKSHGVNIDLIKKDAAFTDVMNIIIPSSNLNDNSIIHSWYSPITNKKTMEFRDNLPLDLPEEILSSDLYILLDKFEPINLEFLNKITNKKVCLDVGHVRYLEHFTKQYLTNFFKNADLIQLNQNVTSLLFERLQIMNEFDFFNLLDLDFLVITNGKKGASFIYKENNELVRIDKSPEVIAELVDSSGAGDAFFATLVRNYAYHTKIDDEFIVNTFIEANKASREVVSQIGSRRK